MHRIYVMNVMPLLDEVMREEALNYLEADRLSRLTAIKTELARAQSIGAGLLLAYAVCRPDGDRALEDGKKQSGQHACEYEVVQVQKVLAFLKDCPAVRQTKVRKTPMGKPGFSDCGGVFFNLSHSGEYAACVLADREAGLDIQKEQGAAAVQRIAPRILHSAEGLYREDVSMLYRLWTVKEAYVKATGEGICRDFREICVDFEKETVQGIPFLLREPAPGYLLAVCILTDSADAFL